MISFVQVANLRMNLPAATNVKARAPDSEEDETNLISFISTRTSDLFQPQIEKILGKHFHFFH